MLIFSLQSLFSKNSLIYGSNMFIGVHVIVILVTCQQTPRFLWNLAKKVMSSGPSYPDIFSDSTTTATTSIMEAVIGPLNNLM